MHKTEPKQTDSAQCMRSTLVTMVLVVPSPKTDLALFRRHVGVVNHSIYCVLVPWQSARWHIVALLISGKGLLIHVERSCKLRTSLETWSTLLCFLYLPMRGDSNPYGSLPRQHRFNSFKTLHFVADLDLQQLRVVHGTICHHNSLLAPDRERVRECVMQEVECMHACDMMYTVLSDFFSPVHMLLQLTLITVF